ncbi:MAG: hypothetical protein R8K50_01375 [Mariprofundus sp.]
MSKRTLTIMLCISLLLVIRLASHLTTPEHHTATLALQTAESSVTTHHSATAAPATEQNRLPGQTPATNSLAQLEAFLIPDAAATASPDDGTAQASSLPVDDKTLASLRSYKAALDQRSAALDKRAKEMQQTDAKLQQRITELEQLEASIQQRLKDEAGIKSKKIKRLTTVYEGMKPDKAAPVIANMELVTVVKIFSLMDEKKVGKIMSFLPAGKAVEISQALTRQISTVK